MLTLLKRMGVALTVMSFGMAAQAQQKPPKHNLVQAQDQIQILKADVGQLISLANGGGGGGEGNSCERIQNHHQCVQQDCHWSRNGEFGRCVTRFGGHRVAENDFAGNLALHGMSIGLNKLSQVVFQATANYYTPQFWFYWNKACYRSMRLPPLRSISRCLGLSSRVDCRWETDHAQLRRSKRFVRRTTG